MIRAVCALALVLGACRGNQGGPVPTDRVSGAAAPGKGSAVAPKSRVSPEDEAQMKAALARHFDVSASEVDVYVPRRMEVPGVTLFGGSLPSEGDDDSGSYASGLLRDGKVVLDRGEAMKIVAAALGGYGKQRTVPPAVAAKPFAFLESNVDGPTSAILTDEDVQELAPTFRQGVFVPREGERDGLPTLEYWTSGSGEDPIRFTRLIFHPDGRVEVTHKPKPQG